MNKQVDYFKVLELSFGADKSEITSSYRRLCKLFHPDINPDPNAEEAMKQINTAYYILCDDIRRADYIAGFSAARSRTYSNPSYTTRSQNAKRVEMENNRALAAVVSYFEALKNGDYKSAYDFTSSYDKQFVTYQSFRKWRRSVQKIFAIQDFSAKLTHSVSSISLENGQRLPAKKVTVDIAEQNLATSSVVRYQLAKEAVCESDVWRVFLGYRDLGEIAKMFDDLSRGQEQSRMAEFWEQHCTENCSELNMRSLAGLLKDAPRELYRCERYGQELTIACFRISPKKPEQFSGELAELADSAAPALITAVRELDIPAYIGESTFAVLFAEIRKDDSAKVTERIAAEISKKVSADMRMDIHTKAAYSIYSGGKLEDYLDKLQEILDK